MRASGEGIDPDLRESFSEITPVARKVQARHAASFSARAFANSRRRTAARDLVYRVSRNSLRGECNATQWDGRRGVGSLITHLSARSVERPPAGPECLRLRAGNHRAPQFSCEFLQSFPRGPRASLGRGGVGKHDGACGARIRGEWKRRSREPGSSRWTDFVRDLLFSAYDSSETCDCRIGQSSTSSSRQSSRIFIT